MYGLAKSCYLLIHQLSTYHDLLERATTPYIQLEGQWGPHSPRHKVSDRVQCTRCLSKLINKSSMYIDKFHFYPTCFGVG